MSYSPTQWHRVSRRRHCPICDKPDWCMFAGDPDNPTVALCQRIESQKRCGDAGWLHRLRDDDQWRPNRRRTVSVPVAEPLDVAPAPTLRHIAQLAQEFCQAVDAAALERLADGLGLSVESLKRLRVGWSAEHGAWTFPMTNTAGDVCGIRLRLQDGRKLSVRGGHEGLFIPSGLDTGQKVLIAEGPTDTAALLDFGFAAIGRPSCTGGLKLLVEFCKTQKPTEVAIVSDGDGPGWLGAESLAVVLMAHCQAIRVIAPPDGIDDAREWKRAGATRQEVEKVIQAAPVRRLSIHTRTKG